MTGKNKELSKQQKILADEYKLATDDLQKLSDKGLIAKKSYEDLETTLNRLTQKPHKIQVILETTEQFVGHSGNTYSSTGGRHFATGGIVTQPTRAIIGEAGYAEAVVPMNAEYLSTLASEIAKYGNTGGSNVTWYR